ncbi:MAG: dihydroorotate dehydrogenase electron transfer subunit [Cyanobacteria bacterium]|nr:dihydroorotate dehydrogenase electron transfer subunit [Cyanobacteriota bacterium]
MQDYLCEVVRQENIGPDLYLLSLNTLRKPQQVAFACRPGQFVMVDLHSEAFLFRRPFSVLSVDKATGIFHILYKVVGRGTQMMANWQSGFQLSVLGPLGNGFSQRPQAKMEASKTLLVGGGIGVAPLYRFLETQSKSQNQSLEDVQCVYGARTAADLGLPIVEQLEYWLGSDKLMLCTDDGSLGFHGNVAEYLRQNPRLVEDSGHIMVCGPTRMMQACVTTCRNTAPSALIEVSLEEHMPCGTGACSGCVVERADQALPSKVCLEGPVFQAQQLAWEGVS